MKIGRQEAARRLLRSAIKGYVQDDDQLVIHLCAQSALRICRDIIKKISPERDIFAGFDFGDQAQFFRDFASINNFLKHADRGPESVEIDSIHNRNASLIYIACKLYEDAFGAALNEKCIIFFQVYRLKLDPVSRHSMVFDIDPDLSDLSADDVLALINNEFEWDGIDLEKFADYFGKNKM